MIDGRREDTAGGVSPLAGLREPELEAAYGRVLERERRHVGRWIDRQARAAADLRAGPELSGLLD